MQGDIGNVAARHIGTSQRPLLDVDPGHIWAHCVCESVPGSGLIRVYGALESFGWRSFGPLWALLGLASEISDVAYSAIHPK